jgi:hypothetical protein
MRKKKVLVGTITGAFGGVLNGIRAQLIRRTTLGYTVELLGARGAFKKGYRLGLSVAEFHIDRQDSTHSQRLPAQQSVRF